MTQTMDLDAYMSSLRSHRSYALGTVTFRRQRKRRAVRRAARFVLVERHLYTCRE